MGKIDEVEHLILDQVHLVKEKLSDGTSAFRMYALDIFTEEYTPLTSVFAGFGGAPALQVFDYEVLNAVGDVEDKVSDVKGAIQDLDISISNYDLMASGASSNIIGIGNGLRNFNSYFESTYEWYIAGKGKNLATSTTKVGKSTYSITWDYDNGVGAISAYSIAWKNAWLPHLNELSPHNIFLASLYITDLSNVTNAVVRMGAYNLLNNFHQWTFPVSKLNVGWNTLVCPIDKPSSQTGTSPPYNEYWLGVGIQVSDTAVACAGIYTCNWYIKQVLEITMVNNSDINNSDPDPAATSAKQLPDGHNVTLITDKELAGNTAHVKKYYTYSGAVTDGIIWSPAAGKRWYITDIFINISAAATIILEDDLTAGDSIIWKAELAANSGWSHSFTTPLFSGEDGVDLLITTDAGNVYVTVSGYEI